jgi:dTDP-4-amino-4,6-dideoxygalactose transaminase
MQTLSPEHIPIIRPTLPELSQIMEILQESHQSGTVTLGRVVRLLEEEAARFTETKYAVAMSSCTSGLILAFASMGWAPGAEVVVPSFTFAATVQAILWNRLTPVYVDCLPGKMTIDPRQVVKAVGPRTAAIYPVSIFGLPPDMDELKEISDSQGIPLISDSAQGFGSTYKGKPAGGFGLCEVFSLSPTKVVTSIEGGLVTTNSEEMANNLRSMRDYGKGPDGEEMVFNGLSARMSEFHASVGLLSLRNAQALIQARLKLIQKYRVRTRDFRGCQVQELPEDRTSSGNYFTLLIGPDAKMDRQGVREALRAHGIESKKYFYPPVHAHSAFRNYPHRVMGDLRHTWSASKASLALPLYSHMTDSQQDRVCEVLKSCLG